MIVIVAIMLKTGTAWFGCNGFGHRCSGDLQRWKNVPVPGWSGTTASTRPGPDSQQILGVRWEPVGVNYFTFFTCFCIDLINSWLLLVLTSCLINLVFYWSVLIGVFTTISDVWLDRFVGWFSFITVLTKALNYNSHNRFFMKGVLRPLSSPPPPPQETATTTTATTKNSV